MTPIRAILGIGLSTGGNSLSDLCELYDATCSSSLSLGVNQYAVRGVFTDEPIDTVGSTIFAIPLEACLRDDQAPVSTSDQWATRLASCLLDLQQADTEQKLTTLAQQTWLDMLPESDTLRESLPVHWEDDAVSSLCPPMAMTLDSSYFVRADAVAQLQEHFTSCSVRQCHDALDVVQTRSCRVGDPGIRLLAPVFDLLNHGGDSCNAEFLRDGERVVVKTIRKVNAGSEILIDYGDSTRPAWKCLLSYGFVPADNDLGDIVVDGDRYTVGSESIPYELVEAICAKLNLDEVNLTEQVCTYLAECAEDAVSVAKQNAERAATAKNDLMTDLFQSEARALTAFAQGLREFHKQ